jgi:hypothetical protein
MRATNSRWLENAAERIAKTTLPPNPRSRQPCGMLMLQHSHGELVAEQNHAKSGLRREARFTPRQPANLD